MSSLSVLCCTDHRCYSIALSLVLFVKDSYIRKEDVRMQALCEACFFLLYIIWFCFLVQLYKSCLWKAHYWVASLLIAASGQASSGVAHKVCHRESRHAHCGWETRRSWSSLGRSGQPTPRRSWQVTFLSFNHWRFWESQQTSVVQVWKVQKPPGLFLNNPKPSTLDCAGAFARHIVEWQLWGELCVEMQVTRSHLCS